MDLFKDRFFAFISRYRTSLAVFAVIAAAVGVDFVYRASDIDFYSRGMKSLEQDNVDDAIAHFSRALRQNPADPVARFGLGQAYHKKGWLEEAVKQYEQAVQNSSSTLAQAYQSLGQAYQQMNRKEEALSALKKAEALKSRSF